MLASSAAIQAARSRFLGPIRLMENPLLTRIRASPVPEEGVAKELAEGPLALLARSPNGDARSLFPHAE
jgi:hypothetical protein